MLKNLVFRYICYYNNYLCLIGKRANLMSEALRVENIHKSFGNNEVLKGISLKANKGDVTAIIGSSGSGKSTLLRCINLLERPHKGEIFLRGEELKLAPKPDGMLDAVDTKQLSHFRSRIGFVFQSFNLWTHMTVLDNIIEAPVHVLGVPRNEAIERAERLLERVGMADRRDHYPNWLSGGQQQRAAIARALAMEPEVLLFDEPTSALDPELVGEVLRVMTALADEGRTMLVVTHEMGFCREVSNRVVFLHEGRIEEDAAPDEFFNNPKSERVRRFLENNYK